MVFRSPTPARPRRCSMDLAPADGKTSIHFCADGEQAPEISALTVDAVRPQQMPNRALIAGQDGQARGPFELRDDGSGFDRRAADQARIRTRTDPLSCTFKNRLRSEAR